MTQTEYLELLRQTYAVVAVLAEKNGGRVLRLRNRALGRDLILRLYDSPVAAYEAMKALRHDNLPRVYDTCRLSDGQAVLEEFVDGMTVAQVLEDGVYTWRGAKKVLRGICAGVHTLHELGLVHRDIKPENVMITSDGGVKLLDLNVSRRERPEKSQDTQVLGTIGYAPPEQLGIGQSDHRADIYALGVLLNVMLTGRHPSQVLAKGRAGRIIRKCTQIDPSGRYQTVRQLASML